MRAVRLLNTVPEQLAWGNDSIESWELLAQPHGSFGLNAFAFWQQETCHEEVKCGIAKPETKSKHTSPL